MPKKGGSTALFYLLEGNDDGTEKAYLKSSKSFLEFLEVAGIIPVPGIEA